MSLLCPRCGIELGHWPIEVAVAHVNDPEARGHTAENRHVVRTCIEVGEDLDRQSQQRELERHRGQP